MIKHHHCHHDLQHMMITFDIYRPCQYLTLWLFNIAMENGPFIDDFPIKTSIYKGFSMAMLNNQMVICKSPRFRMIQPLRTIKDVLVFYFSTMPVESKKEIRQIS